MKKPNKPKANKHRTNNSAPASNEVRSAPSNGSGTAINQAMLNKHKNRYYSHLFTQMAAYVYIVATYDPFADIPFIVEIADYQPKIFMKQAIAIVVLSHSLCTLIDTKFNKGDPRISFQRIKEFSKKLIVPASFVVVSFILALIDGTMITKDSDISKYSDQLNILLSAKYVMFCYTVMFLCIVCFSWFYSLEVAITEYIERRRRLKD